MVDHRQRVSRRPPGEQRAGARRLGDGQIGARVDRCRGLSRSLWGFGSGVGDDTVAVFVMVPGGVEGSTRATMVIGGVVAPAARVPSWQVTRVSTGRTTCRRRPRRNKRQRDGKTSVTTTEWESEGPLFVTLRV